MRYVVRALVFVIGALVLLGTYGISVTPILTTFGIGGVAIALGLQDTLGNLFAGMQVTLAGNIRVGDFIRLESGEEGYIEDIHWRATRIRTIPNNVVLIPNAKLAQSVVTNYHLPDQELAVLVDVGVHYSSDLEQVERVATSTARTVLAKPFGGVASFEPFLRFHRFGDSSIDCTITLRATSFRDGMVLRHEFIKALARDFTAAGIVIPFPIRAINYSQEQPPGAPPSGGAPPPSPP